MAGTRGQQQGTLYYPTWCTQMEAWLSPPVPLGRVPEVRQTSSPAPAFDALISLGAYNLPLGTDPSAVVVAVHMAVSALPGAGWIDVQHLEVPLGSDCRWLEMFPRGGSEPMVGADWRQLRDLVQRLVLEVASGARPAPTASSDTE
jgi:hypothetical protein